MNRVSIYQIPVAADVMGAAIAAGTIPPALTLPMQALVAAIAHRAAEAPVRIYVGATDDSAPARDGFAYVLAKSLMAHVPSALVVDCDFLKLGLHGLVPQSDALGLLDFLLYGSSIGVVTQESPSGVRVVGAGSFPVTKRMPFVVPAFEDAARRLAAHARAALFVGPLLQEDGTAHPLASEVDLAIVVRSESDVLPSSARRSGPDVDAIEEGIASQGVDVWSVRATLPEPKPARPTEVPRVPDAAPRPPMAASRPPGDPGSRPPAKPKTAPTVPLAEASAGGYSSIVPRVAIFVFALLVIGFVSWWMWQGRSQEMGGDDASKAASAVVPETGASPLPRDSIALAASDSTRATRSDTVPSPVVAAPVRPSDTGGRTGGTVLVDPSDILVMDDLARRWNGWYAIHISSFQESIRAREEVSFLQSREFPVFIVFLDLGPKGKWYRVYAGPFETREEAREVKKNLDAIPQVRFTRVTKIPE